jgi:long-subunit fatty acid transport protein
VISRSFVRRLAVCAWVALAEAAVPAPAQATPLDDPHVGGIGFTGPTTGDLTSIYWNPAAVGLIARHQFMAGATARLTLLSADRSSIDPATGRPGPGREFPKVNGRSDLHPLDWPLGPGAFLAMAASLGNRFTLGIATYTPFAQRVRLDQADGQEPNRYHAVSTDLRNLALVPALSIRLGGGVRIGAAPGFLFSVGRIVIDEDTALGGGTCGSEPCEVENPAAAARYDVSSGMDLFDSSLSFTLGVGIHVEHGRWSIGASYLSRPLATKEGTEINGRDTQVIPPPRAGEVQLCPPGVNGSCVSGHAVYRLPDMVVAGADYRLNERFTVGAILRWLDMSQHDAIRMRIVGPASGSLRALGLEKELVLYRGLRDVLDSRLRLITRMRENLELATSFRVETPASPRQSVSAAFIDGWQLEPSVAARMRVLSWLHVNAGYAFGFMPGVNVTNSIYDPTAVTTCNAAGGDLTNPACAKRAAGQASPTAAGRYQSISHSFGLTVQARL